MAADAVSRPGAGRLVDSSEVGPLFTLRNWRRQMAGSGRCETGLCGYAALDFPMLARCEAAFGGMISALVPSPDRVQYVKAVWLGGDGERVLAVSVPPGVRGAKALEAPLGLPGDQRRSSTVTVTVTRTRVCFPDCCVSHGHNQVDGCLVLVASVRCAAVILSTPPQSLHSFVVWSVGYLSCVEANDWCPRCI